MSPIPLTPQQWQNQLIQLEAELNEQDCSEAKRLIIYLGLAELYYTAQNYRSALNQYRLAEILHQCLKV